MISLWHLWLLDPSTEFILSVVERTQGTLFDKKRNLKKQSQSFEFAQDMFITIKRSAFVVLQK
jgi:hypothetical protein